jgi:hypothetical protein
MKITNKVSCPLCNWDEKKFGFYYVYETTKDTPKDIIKLQEIHMEITIREQIYRHFMKKHDVVPNEDHVQKMIEKRETKRNVEKGW